MSREEVIDLRPAKRAARRILPLSHPVREALSREPDVVAREEGLAKLAAYVRVLLVTGRQR